MALFRSTYWALCGPVLVTLAIAGCGEVVKIGSDGGLDGDGGGGSDANAACAQCDDNADCIGEGEDTTCQCREGFRGDGLTCANIDECSEGLAGCHDVARCVDTVGSFECRCLHGHVGDGVEECRTGLIFLANAVWDQADDDQRYFRSYDVASGELRDEPVMLWDNNDFCNCGYTYRGPVSSNGSLYYFANDAHRFTSSWVMLPYPQSKQRGEYGAVAVGERIYLVGGREGSSGAYGKSVNYYDTESHTWSAAGEIPDYPWVVSWVGLGLVGNQVFGVGGNVDGEGSDNMAVYTPGSGWEILSKNMGFDAWDPVVNVYGQRLLVQNCRWSGPGCSIHFYDTETGDWDPNTLPMPDGPAPWHSIVLESRLFAVGEELGQIYLYEWDGQASWELRATLPGNENYPLVYVGGTG